MIESTGYSAIHMVPTALSILYKKSEEEGQVYCYLRYCLPRKSGRSTLNVGMDEQYEYAVSSLKTVSKKVFDAIKRAASASAGVLDNPKFKDVDHDIGVYIKGNRYKEKDRVVEAIKSELTHCLGCVIYDYSVY